LLTDQDEISNLHRGPSIDTPYQVSVQLANQFQGRRFKEIDLSKPRIAYLPTSETFNEGDLPLSYDS